MLHTRKPKNKFFKRLRLRGYKKVFLKKLFRKVKHSSRNILLKISPQQRIEGNFYSQTQENDIIESAEQIFHETFSNEFFNLMENVLNSNGETISINDHSEKLVVNIEVCFYIFYKINIENIETKLCCFCVFIFLPVQEINPDPIEDRLNFMLPGCLFPFKDRICKLFAKEKSKFLANKRFNAVFSNTSLQPAFKNRQNIKNLVSRSKI